MSERENFEAWARDFYPSIGKDDPHGFLDWDKQRGRYKRMHTQGHLDVWQAALASDGRRSVEDIEAVSDGLHAAYVEKLTSSDIQTSIEFLLMKRTAQWCLGSQDESSAVEFASALTNGRKLRTKDTGSEPGGA